MKITLNGQEKQCEINSSLEDLITSISPDNPHIIVELNGSIIKKSKWYETIILENDKIELITFVGGG